LEVTVEVFYRLASYQPADLFPRIQSLKALISPPGAARRAASSASDSAVVTRFRPPQPPTPLVAQATGVRYRALSVPTQGVEGGVAAGATRRPAVDARAPFVLSPPPPDLAQASALAARMAGFPLPVERDRRRLVIRIN
jgi:hypothetical protein